MEGEEGEDHAVRGLSDDPRDRSSQPAIRQENNTTQPMEPDEDSVRSRDDFMPIELIHAVIAVVFLVAWAYIAKIVLHEGCHDARTRQEASDFHLSIRVDEPHTEGMDRGAKTRKEKANRS